MNDLYDEYVGMDLTEDEVRSIVGAPSREESETCICGKPLDSSHMACYEHMSKGY
jgi:hypothetical protein